MEEYLDFAKDLALKAGVTMLKHFQVGVQKIDKADNSPVTVADKAINSMVIESVKLRYPSHSIIGEEESFKRDGAEYVWVCDPIDGTLPYTFGIANNVFSIAMVNTSDGQPVLAVVYDPYMKRMYSAMKGKGAFLNGKEIEVNKKTELSDSVIGLSGTISKVVNSVGYKGALIAACYRPLILNSVVYEAMLIATGQMAASVFPGDTVHDVVTAKLIVEEAGGKVTNLFNKGQRYDQPVEGVIVSNGLVHDQVLKIVSQYKK